MYIADYHLHSDASPDGHSTISELAKAGIDAGLSELCVTDHCECNGFFKFDRENLPAGIDIYYKERILEQREKALALFGNRIKLLHGIEIAQGYEAKGL